MTGPDSRHRSAHPTGPRSVGTLTLAAALLLVACGPGEDGSSARLEASPARETQAAGPHDPMADSLVGAWIAAVGGMDRYRELRTARFTLTTEWYDPPSGRLRRTRPRYITIARTPLGEPSRLERWEGDDFIQQGWDGRTTWARMNGEPLAGGHMDYDQVQYVASDVQYWISLPYKLRDPGVFLHDGGRDERGLRIVEVSFGEGVGDHQDNWRYYFADGEAWPLEAWYREENRANWSRLRFEDRRTVDGYVFAGRRVHFDDQGRTTRVIATGDFELNPELDEGIFSMP